MGSLLLAVGLLVVGAAIALFTLGFVANKIDKSLEDAGAYEEFTEEEIMDETEERLPEKELVTLVVFGDKAYWVENNSIMFAPVNDMDDVDFSSAMRYNAITAPHEELKMILSILDTIKENT